MIKFRHFGIVIKDWKKAEKFYCRILGFKVLKKNTIRGKLVGQVLCGWKVIDYKYVWVVPKSLTYIKLIDGHNKTNSLEFYVFKNLSNTYCDVCHHIAFTVDNINDLFEKLIQNHVRVLCKPQKAPDSNTKLMFCTDHEGNLIEFCEDSK